MQLGVSLKNRPRIKITKERFVGVNDAIPEFGVVFEWVFRIGQIALHMGIQSDPVEFDKTRPNTDG